MHDFNASHGTVSGLSIFVERQEGKEEFILMTHCILNVNLYDFKVLSDLPLLRECAHIVRNNDFVFHIGSLIWSKEDLKTRHVKFIAVQCQPQPN